MKKTMMILACITPIVVSIMILYWVSIDMPAWSNGAAIMFDVLYRLCEAYLVSLIFFVLVEFIPYKRKLKLLESDLKIRYYYLIMNLSEFLIYMYKGLSGNHVTNRKSNVLAPDNELFASKFEYATELFKNEQCGTVFTGSAFTMLSGIDHFLAIRLFKDCIQLSANQLLLNSDIMDDEVTINVRKIATHPIFNAINIVTTLDGVKRMVKIRQKDFIDLNNIYCDLFNILVDSGYIKDFFIENQKSYE